jgi:LacI family transcriptional regulator
MSQPPTIRDISEATGLSTYSVSQALAGKPGVGEATRRRVLQAADELGYVRNNFAANLKDATSKTIGVLSANGRNTYYAVLVQAIDGVLQAAGYHAVTNDAMRGDTYRYDLERQGVQELLQQRVAAVVATYSLAPDSLALLHRWGVPVVFVDSPPPKGAEQYPFVGVDNQAASADVANYLADLGHAFAIYLGYPADWSTRAPREEGFLTAAKNRGMKVKVVEARNSSESAYEHVSKLLSRPKRTWPTAIYATNVVLLQGTLAALKNASVTVPTEISVIGFDDFDWAELVDPPMTVVDQHISDVGATAGETVLRLIADRSKKQPHDGPVGDIILPTNLIIRSSTASPPSR